MASNDDETQMPGCFAGFRKLLTIPGAKTATSKGISRTQLRPEPKLHEHLQPSSSKYYTGTEAPAENAYLHHFPCCMDITTRTQTGSASSHELDSPPPYVSLVEKKAIATSIEPEIMQTVDEAINGANAELRKISLQIHDHPELKFEERFAHDTLTAYLSSQDFIVTRHYLGLETAWRAEFAQGTSGRVIGVNSEMDALPGMGHGCGHNLIAIAGIAVALALKGAMQAHNIAGKIILLGTPAEESGGGKILLLERGAYDEMDICIMCHPGPGPTRSVMSGALLALQTVTVEYFGHAAHAAYAPWEGQNALDAAFLAYSGISVMRQQMQPDCRVHGIIEGRDWAPNIIPDYAKMNYIVRAPSYPKLAELCNKVRACFEGAATAASCTIRIQFGQAYYDVQQNSALAHEFGDIIQSRYGMTMEYQDSAVGGSSDFGNVSYKLPSFHPVFSIPTELNGGNHTPAFTKSARTPAAHSATLLTSQGLAITGLRVLRDEAFFNDVKKEFKKLLQGNDGPRT